MAKFKTRSSKQLGGGCLSLFGLPFLLGGVFMTGLYFSGFADWWRARSWEEVPCRIESVELKASRGDDSTTYRALATYRYQYGGREYHGDRVGFSESADNIGSYQRDVHAELSTYVGGTAKNAEADPHRPKTRTFRCYVNPDKPEEAVLYRTLRWQMQAFMAIFALTFPAVGAGLVAGGFISARAMKKDAELRRNHPGEPWKWKADWAGESMPESDRGWNFLVYLYTVWSGLVIWPLIAATAMSGALMTDKWALLVLIFAGVWCLVARAALKRLRQRWAVGSLRFEMAGIPAFPGGAVEGVIVTERPLPVRGDAQLTLTCERKSTRASSDGDSTTTEKIWSHDEPVMADGMTRDVSGFRLPVSFVLPLDAPESEGGADPMVKHVWKLQLKVAGTPINSTFEVPVFRTSESPVMAARPTPGQSFIAEQVAADLPALLAARRIQAEFDDRGFPTRIHCPAARQRALIGFLIVFNLVWTGVAAFLIHKEAPLVFRVVWPVSAAAIWLAVFYQILHRRTVTFSPAGVEAVDEVSLWTRRRSLARSEITGFSHDTNMSSGNTVFYRVRMEDVFGRKTTLVSGITESTTAEALARRLDEWREA